ncbi:uncharacterized membrane protein At3g27390 [Carica papaya]|uniref:uncharacterized membrane protein At3g27390 n=1 Tax=Carica papaya TaxID=3649 RepID=UPI000B8C9908|nr:uncharacterized membrane protein At3g27390 [Carica papaya]XP_021890402.1 uncharacterized membrane protein At3g27390 [Carica papaya]XP_021890403.1 uncharacterized membrane protein At3g27390 [Carica papaya]
MEPPKGFLLSLWHFICFLPYFIGLLLLGILKGIIFCPLICVVMTIGNSGIILGLLPVHAVWTCYCILSTRLLGPLLKFFLCICLLLCVGLWPVLGIAGSILAGALYGFLSPVFATFDAVGEGKSNMFFHCFFDGTWSTVKGSITVVRDFRDVCLITYFSLMSDLRQQVLPDGKCYEIRLLHLPGAIVAGILGIIVDLPVISVIALCKSPYMLLKGWRRLFHDLIGREGPFLETICVPFAGLVILLWPLAVIGAVLGSIVASVFLGAYAGVIAYQESSFWFGLCYIVASLAIYDEYSNDVLDMREGSCFPRPKYQKKTNPWGDSRASSFSKPPSRVESFNTQRVDLNPLELLEALFKECQRQGEIMVSEGLITQKDIADAKAQNGGKVISIGLPAYCILQSLLCSAISGSPGLLLSDGTEITSANRPKDAFFDWFFNPFMIMKDQMKVANLSEAEEDYLGKLVLLCGDATRLKILNINSPTDSELRRAELDGLARRLQGLTKSISRSPTYWRQFENLVKTLSDNLSKKNDGSISSNGSRAIQRSWSALPRMFSLKSFKRKTSSNGFDDSESQPVVTRDVDIV